MAERVAVYIDFDNVVISRYDSVHGTGSWHDDDARNHTLTDPRLAEAKVELGAIIDYATSYGVVAMTRAYADWSVPANAAYRRDVVERAVDLVQLFAASGTKNGADIRLAVDAVEDLSRHSDITHVVLVAGDSDYVPLAQRCKMKRIDPAFDEKALGFTTFKSFAESRPDVVETIVRDTHQLLRLR